MRDKIHKMKSFEKMRADASYYRNELCENTGCERLWLMVREGELHRNHRIHMCEGYGFSEKE